MIGYSESKPDDGRRPTIRDGVETHPASGSGAAHSPSPSASSRSSSPAGGRVAHTHPQGNRQRPTPAGDLSQHTGAAVDAAQGIASPGEQRGERASSRAGSTPAPRATHGDGTCWNPHDTQGRSPESVEIEQRKPAWGCLCIVAFWAVVWMLT